MTEKEMYKGKDWPEYNRENEEYTDLISFKALIYFITRDFERINRKISFLKLLKSLLLEPGFKFIFWLRITRYFFLHKKFLFFFFFISRLFLKHYSYKYNFDISYRTKILPGLAISHHGYVLVSGSSIIGSNCFLRPGVVLGGKSLFDVGPQIIGDNVEFGVGSKVIGGVKIGDNVTVGANAVVTHDTPDNCVVGGIPAKVIRVKQKHPYTEINN